MDIVKSPNIDWLGKKWIFIGVSFVLALISAVSFLLAGGMNLGVDFTGGTLVYVKFRETPDLERIRRALVGAELSAEEVTRFDEPSMNEVQIRMARLETAPDQDLSERSQKVRDTLFSEYDESIVSAEQIDLNNVSSDRLSNWLQQRDPEDKQEALTITSFAQHYDDVAQQIIGYRTQHSGLIGDLAELNQVGVSEATAKAIQEGFYLGSFVIISVESVGPKVGKELRDRAQGAILFSLLGMLIYIAFRFRPIYGLAAIVALFHDVFLTLGFFSLTGKEISLTVIAALLTLVGYSINDTIVVFDRVRENLKLMRRKDLATIINTSINQTLNRTIMTSGMTFLAVFALFMLGGEALSGFSFALVIGIVVGTYSSVAIASPIVLWWQNYSESRKAHG